LTIKEVFMPININIFLHERVSLELALLFDYIFRFPDKFTDEPLFKPVFVQAGKGRRFGKGAVSVETSKFQAGGYLIIPPMEAPKGTFIENTAESAMIKHAMDKNTTVATACLGAFLPAAAGMLDGFEATTHWHWLDYAKENFPNVSWNTNSMLCHKDGMITSGGLLSLIDLALYIISLHSSKEFTAMTGRFLLADTVRQKQSVYAQSLVGSPAGDSRFALLTEQINTQPEKHLEVSEMADMCGMSLRNFHRAFVKNFGTTPNKYIQLKRLERAKELLAETDMSIEETAGRVGFTDTSFFRSVFSRETGMTPTQFRKRIT
jgi:transcriptional regulator GlxA family with amidase domain